MQIFNSGDIEIKSEELNDIIGKKPSWIIRFGITVLFVIIVILLSLSYLIKFPYIITSRITITTEIPPFSLVSRASGRVRLFVKEDEKVSRGQLLGGIENSAKFDDVFVVKKRLKKIKESLISNSIYKLPRYNLNDDLFLGELQVPYLALMKSIENLRLSHSFDLNRKQLEFLSIQLKNYEDIGRKSSINNELHKNDENIVKNRLRIDSVLMAKKIISKVEFDNSKRNYFQTKIETENFEANSLSNLIQLSSLRSQILQLENVNLENEKNLNIALKEAINTFEVQIDLWERKYLLIAPNTGVVNILFVWTNDQLVNNDQEIMRVIPPTNSLFSRAFVPVSGSGKLAINQNVNIKFDNYLYTEYGIVKGRVKSISQVPINGSYSVVISLPNGLTTGYGKELPFKQEMQGSAEIITSNISIIERIFNQFRSIVDNINN